MRLGAALIAKRLRGDQVFTLVCVLFCCGACAVSQTAFFSAAVRCSRRIALSLASSPGLARGNHREHRAADSASAQSAFPTGLSDISRRRTLRPARYVSISAPLTIG